MRFLLFFLVWTGTIGLAFWYVSRRLLNRPQVPRRLRRRFRILMFLLFLLIPLPFFFMVRDAESGLLDTLSWGSFTVMGLFSLLFTGLLLRDLVMLPGALVGRLRRRGAKGPADKDGPEAPSRREFLLHTSNMAILTGTAVLGTYGFTEARRRPRIDEVTIPLAGLPAAFDGFRIVQFSDLHVGLTIKKPVVEEMVEIIGGLRGDLIAFTGDLVDGSVEWLRDDVAPLRALSARHGVYFVTGNHEYYSGAEEWVAHARELGFDVLMNEHRVLRRQNEGIVLAGVTDYTGGDFLKSHVSDPEAALRGAPAAMPRLLLAHQPRSIDDAARAGVDLQLSGHTHGGQFFPWGAITRMGQPYLKGTHRHGGTWIHVNTGCAYWGPPLRLGIPPEITVVTLRRAV